MAVYGGGEEEGYADGSHVAVGGCFVDAVGVDDGVGERFFGFALVVVDDDDVESGFVGGFNRLEGKRAAIDRDDDSGALVFRGLAAPSRWGRSLRSCGRGCRRWGRHRENGNNGLRAPEAGGAVDIVIAEDGDFFARGDGGRDAGGGFVHVEQVRGVGQGGFEARRQKCFGFFDSDAAGREDAGQNLREFQLLRQGQRLAFVVAAQNPFPAGQGFCLSQFFGFSQHINGYDSGMSRQNISPNLHYIRKLYAPQDALLASINETLEKLGIHMQIGPEEGKMLQMLIVLHQVRSVVELGTLAGYSTLWMARALPDDGHIYTIDNDEKHIAMAGHFFDQSDVRDRITQLAGDGPEVLAELSQKAPFDMIFIDADKGGYNDYLDWAETNVRQFGLVVADNTLLFDTVALDKETPGPHADSWEAMRRFNERLADEGKYFTIMLPTQDGLTVAIKLF